MNRIFTLIAVTLFSVSLFAEKVKIGDLCYNLDGDNMTAEVTYETEKGDNYAGLTIAIIPDSVLYLGYHYAVTAIGEWAFEQCPLLQSVTIGSGVQSIGKMAFLNSPALATIEVVANNQTYCSIDGVLFTKDTLTLIQYPIGNTRTAYTIPDNVQVIGEWAFRNCSSLQSVTIGSGVQTIGEWAFSNCSSLQSVTIPDNVRYILEGAFSDCRALATIYNRAATPQSIDANVFDGVDKNACTLYVPAESITAYQCAVWWYEFGNILGIYKASGRYKIGDLYYNLNGDNLTAEVTYDKQYAETNYSGLIAATIPDSVLYNGFSYAVTAIGEDAFFNCHSLQSVTIGDNVQIIEESAFSYCDVLQSVTIGDRVQIIRFRAFSHCSSLQSVTIGDNVQTIEERAFQLCSALATINVATNNQNFCSVDGVLFTKDTLTLIQYPMGNPRTAYTISDSVKTIGNSAFYLSKALQSVTIGSGVQTIGRYAFTECKKLQSVIIPDNVQTIEEGAFVNCASLQSVIIGKNVQSIGENAFLYIWSLQSIYNRATTPQSINANVFDNVDKSACTLYVPTESVEAYQNASVWKDFNICYPVSGRYKIGDLYYNLNGDNMTAEVTYETEDGDNYARLTTATIPDSVKYKGYYYAVNAIEEDAFRDCDMLQSVTIGNGVKTIGQRAFYYCTSLYSISIKGKVRTIGFSAFYNCSSLQSVTIGDNVQTIEKGAFYNCTSLRSVTIGNGVQTIGEYAFYNCYSMHSVAIGSGVQTIGRYAFTECEKLQSVIIPDNVQTIEEGAFGNCASLQSITIGSGVQTIGNHAFVFCGNLATIINRAATPQTIDESVFYNVNKDACSLYVPTESLTGYQNADVWKEFFSIRSIGSQGIHDVQSDNVQSTKVIRNGQVYIMCNGQMYNMQGQEVK